MLLLGNFVVIDYQTLKRSLRSYQQYSEELDVDKLLDNVLKYNRKNRFRLKLLVFDANNHNINTKHTIERVIVWSLLKYL